MKNYNFQFAVIFGAIFAMVLSIVFGYLLFSSTEKEVALYFGFGLAAIVFVLLTSRLIYDIVTYCRQRPILKNGIITTAELINVAKKRRDMNGHCYYITLKFTNNEGKECEYELPTALHLDLLNGIKSEEKINVYAYQGKCLLHESYLSRYGTPSTTSPFFRNGNHGNVRMQNGVETVVRGGSESYHDENDETFSGKVSTVVNKTVRIGVIVKNVISGVIIAAILIFLIISLVK